MKRFRDFIDEATKPADKDSKGPFAIATKTRKGSLKRVPDTRFDTYDSAHKYGMQYHTDRYGSQMFHVVHHPDAKKKMDESIDESHDGLQLVRSGHWKHKNGSIHWESDRVKKKGVGTYRVMRGDDLSSKDPKKYRTLSAAKKALDEMAVRDAAGKLIPIRKQTFRGADMKLRKAYPGKSSSSGGGGNGD